MSPSLSPPPKGILPFFTGSPDLSLCFTQLVRPNACFTDSCQLILFHIRLENRIRHLFTMCSLEASSVLVVPRVHATSPTASVVRRPPWVFLVFSFFSSLTLRRTFFFFVCFDNLLFFMRVEVNLRQGAPLVVSDCINFFSKPFFFPPDSTGGVVWNPAPRVHSSQRPSQVE